MKTKTKKKKSAEMVAGIKAIIYLQGLAGITETPGQATKGWLAMSANDKAQTMAAYEQLNPLIPEAR